MPPRYYTDKGLLLKDQHVETVGGYMLPGSTQYEYGIENGIISLQELSCDQYTIRLHLLHCLRKFTVRMIDQSTQLWSCLALQGSWKLRWNAVQLELKVGQFTAMHSPLEAMLHCSKNISNQSFEIGFSPALYEQLTTLRNDQSSQRSSFFYFKNKPARLWAHSHMLDIIRNLMACPYSMKMREFYFDNKVREYLFLMHVQFNSLESLPGMLSEKETAAVYEAKRMILEDLETHYTIREIAKSVQLNEFKLKQAFKSHFGSGIFETLLKARMERAHLLLLETDKPIKEIAALSGYEHLTSFITAFRKHFGYTPGAMRRQ